MNTPPTTHPSAAPFDCFTAVPHPDNLSFIVAEERRAMHRLGMKLVEIDGSHDSGGMQYAAHTVQHHFWRELELVEEPKRIIMLPSFLQAGHELPHIELAEFAKQLATVAIDASPMYCIITANLNQLQRLLNLSATEIQFLKLAYLSSHYHHSIHNDACNLKTTLSFISLAGTAHRNHAIAVLLDEPLAAVDALFSLPSKLVALGFMDAQSSYEQRSLQELCALNENFIYLLESPHRSEQAIVTAILEHEEELDPLLDGTVPVGYLIETMPQNIAECYERAVLNEPLLPQHIQQLVAWFTGGYVLPLEAAQPLAARITFESMREAIKRSALSCCQANQPYGAYALLKGLYAAST
jgi:hypothetical protein